MEKLDKAINAIRPPDADVYNAALERLASRLGQYERTDWIFQETLFPSTLSRENGRLSGPFGPSDYGREIGSSVKPSFHF